MKLLNALVLYTGSSVLLKGAGFALFVWLARTLPTDEYAQWGLLYAIQTALATFGLAGIIEAVTNLLSRHTGPDRNKLFIAANGAFARVMGVSIIIASALGAWFVEFSALPGALLSGALLAYATLQMQLLRFEEKQAASLVYSFLVPLGGLVGSLIAVNVVRSAGAFFVGSAIGLAVVLAVVYRRQGPSEGSIRGMIFARLAPYLVIAFFGWLGGYGNNFVVNSLFQSVDVAHFTFALTLGSILQLVASSLNQVWSPHFFKIVRVQPFQTVEDKNWKFYGAQSVLLGGVGAVCIALLPYLLRFLGGNLVEYASLDWELFFVVAGYVCLSPWWHCSNYLLFHDHGPLMMKVSIVTSAIGLLLWFVLMLTLGPIGIYVGFFAQMLLRAIGIALVARQHWRVRISWVGVSAGMLLALGGLIVR